MSRPGEQPLTRHEPVGSRSVVGLAGVVLLATLLVGGAWLYSRERIADNAARRTRAEVAAVLPAGLFDNEPHRDRVLLDTGSGELLPVYRARRHGAPAAAALTIIASDGYVGPIRLLVGIAADGRVLGVQVAEHAETPGIGSAIAANESTWLDVFTGRRLGDPPAARWQLRVDGGDFDAIAGATVSSRAVVSGVRGAVQYFAAHREEIFSLPVDEGPHAPGEQP